MTTTRLCPSLATVLLCHFFLNSLDDGVTPLTTKIISRRVEKKDVSLHATITSEVHPLLFACIFCYTLFSTMMTTYLKIMTYFIKANLFKFKLFCWRHLPWRGRGVVFQTNFKVRQIFSLVLTLTSQSHDFSLDLKAFDFVLYFLHLGACKMYLNVRHTPLFVLFST